MRDSPGAFEVDYFLRSWAHHEAGHVVAAWHLKNAPHPTGAWIAHAGGWQFRGQATHERFCPESATRDELVDSIVVALAGEAAQIEFGFEQPRRFHFRRISSDRARSLGMTGDDRPQAQHFAEIAERSDAGVRRLLREAGASARDLVRDHRSDIAAVATLLVEKKAINGRDIARACARGGLAGTAEGSR